MLDTISRRYHQRVGQKYNACKCSLAVAELYIGDKLMRNMPWTEDASTKLPRPRGWAVPVLILAVVSMPAGASARAITFVEARAAAERQAPDVQLAQLHLGLAAADVRTAGALPNPSLSLSTARQTARLGLSLAQPLPLFGQRATAVRAAQADAEAARQDLGAVRSQVRWSVSMAWIDLWEAQERSRLLEVAAREAERLMQITKEKLDAGTGLRFDVVRARADSERAAAETRAARLGVRAAGARLAPWTGDAPEPPLTAAGLPSYPAEPARGTESGLAEHPLIRRDRAAAVAAVLHLENERRLRWPALTPQVTVNQGDPTLPGTDVIVGLALDLPVMSLRSGPIARAQAQRTLAETTFALDLQRLRSDLADASRRTEGASAKLRSLRTQVLPAMKEARDLTEDAYRLGRADLLRLLEAQRALLETELAEVDAVSAWARAVADLERAAGRDFVMSVSRER
jgi:cobalt-zinc-cadmium efflux system outer membrane protein